MTKLDLAHLSPANILAYVKSSKGKLGKTAGIFNILAKQKEETLQGYEVSPNVHGSFQEMDVAQSSPLKESTIPIINKSAKKVGDWKRIDGKRLERTMK